MSDRDIALVRAALEAAARVADKHWLDTSYHAAAEIRALDPAAIAAGVPVETDEGDVEIAVAPISGKIDYIKIYIDEDGQEKAAGCAGGATPRDEALVRAGLGAAAQLPRMTKDDAAAIRALDPAAIAATVPHKIDVLDRLSGYNPPDRTIDEQRQMAQDIHDAATEIERLRAEVDRLAACKFPDSRSIYVVTLPNGERWACADVVGAEIERLRQRLNAAERAITLMAEDGWLHYGPEGPSEAQNAVIAAIDAAMLEGK